MVLQFATCETVAAWKSLPGAVFVGLHWPFSRLKTRPFHLAYNSRQ